MTQTIENLVSETVELTGASPPDVLREDAPVLDARAIAEFRERLASLNEEMDEARASNDEGRQTRIAAEIEALRDALDSALGLGGRARRFHSESERARVNVTRAIRSSMTRIAASDPHLGAHLGRTIRTGTFCCYDPDPGALPRWTFEQPEKLR